MPWYKGKSIFKTLENIKIKSGIIKEKLRLPIQWVNRTSSDFRGFSGSIVSGKIKKGDVVNILPQGTRAKIKELIVSGKKSQVASKNTAVTVTLDKELDISRGDVLVGSNEPCEISNQFQCNLVWMSSTPGLLGRSHLIKIGHQIWIGIS